MAEIRPDRNFTFIYGLNGQGKTNLLESIYFLGNARPFRSAKLPDLIRHGEKYAYVSGQILSSGVSSHITVHVTSTAKYVSVDGKGIHRSSDLHGKLPVIVFSPDDTSMVKLGPETRRRYIDRALYNCNVGYLHDYHDYYRILKQRNSLLKKLTTTGIDIWTEQLADTGSRLIKHRQMYIEQLNSLFRKHYSTVSGSKESVEISYRPDSKQSIKSNDLLSLMMDNLEIDLRSGTTCRGPHRDDLFFSIESKLLKTFGSHGQQRSFVMALKMAELDYLEETFGEPPILLLDDIASELDKYRINNLMTYLQQKNVQVLITTTTKTIFNAQLLNCSASICVENGTLTCEEMKIK